MSGEVGRWDGAENCLGEGVGEGEGQTTPFNEWTILQRSVSTQPVSHACYGEKHIDPLSTS
jgi:hypothetical protein